jgi:hypothetical protein
MSGEYCISNFHPVGSSQLVFTCFLIVVMLLLVVIGYLGSRKMQTKSSIVPSCSLAISATCHPPAEEKDTYLAQVKWGVVDQTTEKVVDHYALSAGTVKQPEQGKT